MTERARRTVRHFRGALLGGAVGDALGAAVEFDSLGRIRERFGGAGLTDVSHRGLHARRAPGTTCLAALRSGVMGTRDEPVNDGLGHRLLHARFAPAAGFLFLAVASHPLLDALTNGGLGVALLWPFSSERFFAPFRPIQVAPISVRRLLSPRGLAVLASELEYVWLPCALVGALLAFGRLLGREAPPITRS